MPFPGGDDVEILSCAGGQWYARLHEPNALPRGVLFLSRDGKWTRFDETCVFRVLSNLIAVLDRVDPFLTVGFPIVE